MSSNAFSQFKPRVDQTAVPPTDIGVGSVGSSILAYLSPAAMLMLVAALLAGMALSFLFWWRYPLSVFKGSSDAPEYRVIATGRRIAFTIGVVFGLLILAGLIVFLLENWR